MEPPPSLLLQLDRPEKGWIGLRLEYGGHIVETTFSYTPEDSVLQLVEAGYALLCGPTRHSVVLNEEPRELEIVFERGESEIANVTFIRHADHRQRCMAEKVLDIRLPMADIGRAIRRALLELQDSCMPDEYEQEWRHPFPTLELNWLDRRIRKGIDDERQTNR